MPPTRPVVTVLGLLPSPPALPSLTVPPMTRESSIVPADVPAITPTRMSVDALAQDGLWSMSTPSMVRLRIVPVLPTSPNSPTR